MDAHLSTSLPKTPNTRRISPRNNSSAPLPSPRQLASRTDSVIREGNAFQAPVDELETSDVSFAESVPTNLANDDYPDRDTSLWRCAPPSMALSDETLVDYCQLANEHFGINLEQALFILMSLNYDLKKAKEKLKTHVVIPHKFSEQDQSSFRFAYGCYGKNFSKIRQMMSHKSMSSLIQHYYNTKKYQRYKSTIDMDNLALTDESDGIDEKDGQRKEGICENCRNCVKKLHLVNELELCTVCKMYFLAANQHRPCRRVARPKRIVTCPPDMRKTVAEFLHYAQAAEEADFEDADELGELQIACKKETRCEKAIQSVKEEISKVRALAVRAETQACEEFKGLTSSAGSGISAARSFLERTAPPKARLPYSWEDAEKLIALHALILHNCDFAAVAELMGTKTSDMVKSFYHEECKREVDQAIEFRNKNKSSRSAKKSKRIDYDEEFKKLMKPPEVIDLD